MTTLFLTILNRSISASWLILVIILLRWVLAKAPKWSHVLLWGAVAIRLLCPFSVKSALSLIPSAETIGPEIMMQQAPAVQTGLSSLNEVVNPLLQSAFAPAPGASANPLQVVLPVLTVLWLAGAAALVVHAVISQYRLKRRVASAVRAEDGIYQGEMIAAPFVLGIMKPKIYLPFEISEENRAYVIRHERAHIKRRDHWWKLLGYLLLAAYWFNPLVWIAYHLLCRDIELACDEKVIQTLGKEQKAEYSEALLTCSSGRHRPMACPMAFGEVGVKTRIRSVLHYRKPALWLVVLALGLCILTCLCFLTDPQGGSYDIKVLIPAGSEAPVVYSHEEFSPMRSQIMIRAGGGLGDTAVILEPAEQQKETAYDEAYYLTQGMPVQIDVETGSWFRIGIQMQNPTDQDIEVYVNVSGVEVRIE